MDRMRTNALQQVIISEDDMIDVLYTGETINNLIVDDPHWMRRFNTHCKDFELPFIMDWSEESTLSEDEYIRENLSDWDMPDNYAMFDVEHYLLSKCKTTEQIERVQEELQEFKLRDMLGVLIWLKYFVDTLRANNLIWGVGRGSSTASYVLFLLEIHKVDSLKYDLDIKEFLK